MKRVKDTSEKNTAKMLKRTFRKAYHQYGPA
jgi:hypothetical protein